MRRRVVEPRQLWLSRLACIVLERLADSANGTYVARDPSASMAPTR